MKNYVCATKKEKKWTTSPPSSSHHLSHSPSLTHHHHHCLSLNPNQTNHQIVSHQISFTNRHQSINHQIISVHHQSNLKVKNQSTSKPNHSSKSIHQTPSNHIQIDLVKHQIIFGAWNNWFGSESVFRRCKKQLRRECLSTWDIFSIIKLIFTHWRLCRIYTRINKATKIT